MISFVLNNQKNRCHESSDIYKYSSREHLLFKVENPMIMFQFLKKSKERNPL